MKIIVYKINWKVLLSTQITISAFDTSSLESYVATGIPYQFGTTQFERLSMFKI